MPPWAIVLGTLAAAWGADRFSRWQPTPAHTEIARRPRGPEWKLEHQPYHWPRTEAGRRAFVKYLARKLWELKLLPVQAIALFIAHTARETGYGHAVYGNNFGNEKQFWGGPWFNLAGQPYIGFWTPEQGLAHAVLRIKRQWPGPWRKLIAGDPTWYGDLGLGGYYEFTPRGIDENTGERLPVQQHTAETIGPTQQEYNGTLAHVRRLLAT